MNQLQKIGWLLGLTVLLIACGAEQIEPETVANANALATKAAVDTVVSANVMPAAAQPISMGAQQAMPSEAMRSAHMSPIPDGYTDLVSPVSAETDALERGAEVYTTFCAVCHGDGGMGDGPASVTLDPPVAPVAQSSRMMSDAYFFWRISEGGQGDPLTSAMPAWKASLNEQQIWDVITYMRSLGAGAEPRRALGGMQFDPAAEQIKQEAILVAAIDTQLITQDEADLFKTVHDVLDAQGRQGNGFGQGNGRGAQGQGAVGQNQAAQQGQVANGLGQAAVGQDQGNGLGKGQGGQGRGQMQQEQMAVLNQLVLDGVVTEADALAFERIHTVLTEAGLMN
jgi:mono/diheme cytochrome c family protein